MGSDFSGGFRYVGVEPEPEFGMQPYFSITINARYDNEANLVRVYPIIYSPFSSSPTMAQEYASWLNYESNINDTYYSVRCNSSVFSAGVDQLINYDAWRYLSDNIDDFDGNDLKPSDVHYSAVFQSTIDELTRGQEVGVNDLAVRMARLLVQFNHEQPFFAEADQSLIMIDFNRDGQVLGDVSESATLLGANTTRQVSAWMMPQDGALVALLSKNDFEGATPQNSAEILSNALIDDPKQVALPISFNRLSLLDSNLDGNLDGDDKYWGHFRIWQDKNGDGRAEQSELLSLASFNITDINLVNQVTDMPRYNHGNRILAQVQVNTNSDETYAAMDVLPQRYPGDFSYKVDGQRLWVSLNSKPDLSYLESSGQGFVSLDLDEDGNLIQRSTAVVMLLGSDQQFFAGQGCLHAIGNADDNTFSGDAQGNLLVGGKGSDRFVAGDGNDLLVIDADDDLGFVDAGNGFDEVVIQGTTGLTLDMAKLHAEVVHGSKGDDVISTSGVEGVIVYGDEGDDRLTGGAGSDVLGGGDGQDTIDGGEGTDILRGHRGNDRLLGGAAGDLLDGGLGDDALFGGDGDDVLIGGMGSDTLDGGDGIDSAAYKGRLTDYIVTWKSDDIWEVKDKRNGDIDTLQRIERLSFDEQEFDLTTTHAWSLPMRDTFYVDPKSSSVTLTLAQVLGNDWCHRGTPTVLGVANAAGCQVTFDGELFTVTFAANYSGMVHFDYQVQNQLADVLHEVHPDVKRSDTLLARVTLLPENAPHDPELSNQWAIDVLHMLPVWAEHITGQGVQIGIFEGYGNTPFDLTQPELQGALSEEYQRRIAQTELYGYSGHTTAVAGNMVASRDGKGIVGIAYDAKISHYNWEVDGSYGVHHTRDYDVVNNSWGAPETFFDDSLTVGANTYQINYHYRSAVQFGRHGLGTVNVHSAGNDYAYGDDVNAHGLKNSPYVLDVGAINYDYSENSVTFAMEEEHFSTPGANVLVCGPGSDILSLLPLQVSPDGTQYTRASDYITGTSFSGPNVAAVTALILQANPTLGYRDVQSVLANTAYLYNHEHATWQYNANTSLNGVGQHFSREAGFGMVDANAAIALAESLTTSHTYNGIVESNASTSECLPLLSDTHTISQLTINQHIRIEDANILIHLNEINVQSTRVVLISPQGTRSVLFDRPGLAPITDGVSDDRLLDGVRSDLNQDMTFALNSKNFRGEDAYGDWQLELYTYDVSSVGTLDGWQMTALGELIGDDDTYYFNNEFSLNNYEITDTAGNDTLNAAAVTNGDVILDLRTDSHSVLLGHQIGLASGTVIENAASGNGNDVLIGNDLDNHLYAGRGINTLTGNAGADTFRIKQRENGVDTITDFSTTEGDKLDLSDFSVTSFDELVINTEQEDTKLIFGDEQHKQTIVLSNTAQLSLSRADIIGLLDEARQINGTAGNDSLNSVTGESKTELHGYAGDDNFYGGTGENCYYTGEGHDTVFIDINPNQQDSIFEYTPGEDIVDLSSHTEVVKFSDLDISQNGVDTRIVFINGQTLVLKDTSVSMLQAENFVFHGDYLGTQDDDYLTGTEIANTLKGFSGNDQIYGYAGADEIYLGAGNDRGYGGDGNDVIYAAEGNDIVFGDYGDDRLYGGAGNDLIMGGSGCDLLFAGAGTDRLYGNDFADILVSDNGANVLTGGAGNDLLIGAAELNTLAGDDGTNCYLAYRGNNIINSSQTNDSIVVTWGTCGNITIHSTQEFNQNLYIASSDITMEDWKAALVQEDNAVSVALGGHQLWIDHATVAQVSERLHWIDDDLQTAPSLTPWLNELASDAMLSHTLDDFGGAFLWEEMHS